MAPVTILALTDMCSDSVDHRFCLYLDLESLHSSVVHYFFVRSTLYVSLCIYHECRNVLSSSKRELQESTAYYSVNF